MPLKELKQPNSVSNNLAVDIVAVHGLDGHMTETWTDPETKSLWLEDLLPKSLSVGRILTFGYPAHATTFYSKSSADMLQQHAHTLVANVQADRSLEGCSRRPIIFICHGLGGILVKKALSYSSTRTSKHVEHLYSIFASTYAILFFGTPHEGTDKRSWLARTRGGDSSLQARHGKESQLLSAIETQSETLHAITEHFAHLMKQFHIFFFWEERRTDLKDGSRYIVEESSAAPIIDNTERAGIYANHAQMVRFSSMENSSYRTVVEALVRYCRQAPPVISRRWEQAQETLALSWNNEAIELTGTAFDIHNQNRPFQFERKTSERPCNKHFHIPQVVSSIFTGREDVSQLVKKALLSPENHSFSPQQRRFVIHGIGGSGKTQFCSKFAQEHRERFWGVFWVDATTADTAQQAFAKIGKLGKMEATESAGKHWLSNAEEPWLLIINNADDPTLDIPSFFPEGERGHILVTTRNPNVRVHGTVGSIEFKGLKKKDALLLLFRAADTPPPWNSTVKSMGEKITNTLGYLALALVQAGALILQRLCEMHNYLDYYNQFRSKVSVRRYLDTLKREDQYTIYATWEHSRNHLELRQTEACLDAAQVLNIVAFFHFEHIRVDIFTKALTNRLEAARKNINPTILTRIYRNISALVTSPPILPEFLRNENSELDHFRVRRALHELSSLSLISYDGKDDTFSLHPVVHAWARDRLTKGEQSLWAQIALNVLAESVLLPPHDAGEAHDNFRRDILVHMDLCLQTSPIKILDYEACFGGLMTPMLVLNPGCLQVFRYQVLSAAKFGYVYAERGRFNEAAKWLSQVKSALVKARGYQNDMTMRVMLALASVYWALGRLEEAIALQQTVLDSRKSSLGADNAETLSVMNDLGKSYWFYGQYQEALELQEYTVERTRMALGPIHSTTLSAMDNLGVTYDSWRKLKESTDIHRRVLATRTATLGSNHLDTLVSMSNLAMSLKSLGALDEAKELLTEVYEQRKTKLGKEHPWTLWALCNLSSVYSQLRLLQDAEAMLVDGVAAAKRSLSEDHPGVCIAESELARLYARQGRHEAAEDLLQRLVPRMEQSRGLGHPDTLYASFKLAQVHKMRNKVDKAIEVCTLAEERISLKLPDNFPLARDIRSELRQLQGLRDGQRLIETKEVRRMDCHEADDCKNRPAVANKETSHQSHDQGWTTSIFKDEVSPRTIQSYKTF